MWTERMVSGKDPGQTMEAGLKVKSPGDWDVEVGRVTGGKWTFYLSWSDGLLPQWEGVRWNRDSAL